MADREIILVLTIEDKRPTVGPEHPKPATMTVTVTETGTRLTVNVASKDVKTEIAGSSATINERPSAPNERPSALPKRRHRSFEDICPIV